jgi:hypothetical protein
VTGRQIKDLSSYWITLRKDSLLGTERGNTRSRSVENSFGRGCGPALRQKTQRMNPILVS